MSVPIVDFHLNGCDYNIDIVGYCWPCYYYV